MAPKPSKRKPAPGKGEKAVAGRKPVEAAKAPSRPPPDGPMTVEEGPKPAGGSLAWKVLAAGKEGPPKTSAATAPTTPSDGLARPIQQGETPQPHLTKPQVPQKFRKTLEEETARESTVKTVEWQPPKAQPAAPPPGGGLQWLPAPEISAKPAAPSAQPTGAAAAAEAVMASGTKLPPGKPIPEELMDPEDPFPISPDEQMIDYYPIREPHAYVLITYNNHEKDLVYRVVEPRLTKEERKVINFVEHTMVDLIDAPPEALEGKSLEAYLKKKFDEILYDYSIVLGENEAQEAQSKEKLLYYLNRDFIGEGRIDVLTRDDLIEDISCDGPHQPVFIYHRKYESVRTNVKFTDDDELDSFVIRMAQRAGKHVSIAEPILDATMRDGSRLQSTLSHEVSSHGSTFTIRKFRQEPFTPPDLVRFGTQSPEILAYWWLAIQYGASAIYAGGTASGKTTSLNAILLFIPYQMKIVSIEDTRELSIPHPNWIAGITRSGFGPRDREGRQAGEIDMFQLLKNALRQRPEYIVVGEVRGQEAYNLFQAMATGHAAYGTMHADSVDAVIHRLESDPINIPRSLLEALDIISIQIQTRVGGKRVRRTKQVAEIVGLDPHTREILTNEVFRWVPKDDAFKFSGVSYVLERIQVEKGMTPQQMKQEIENRVEVIKYMIRWNIRNYRDCARVIAAYYKDVAAVMTKVRSDQPWT